MKQSLINALASIKAKAVRTSSEDPLQKYKFRITVDGLPTGLGFQKIAGLSDEIEMVEYLEGGYDSPHKLQGRRKVGDLTCERGSYATKELEDLYKQSWLNDSFRKTVVIELMDKFGTPKRSWKLDQAWVQKWEGPEMDASSSDVAVEKMTIVFEQFL